VGGFSESITAVSLSNRQAQIHGQRVELRDIEFNLRNLLPPKTNLVVELVRPFDAPDRAILTAFCETRSESGSGERKQAMSEAQAVFKHAQQGLSDVLPQHMIPRAFISLEQLPQNSSNKTDRRKLRDDASKLGYKHLTASSPSARNSKAGEDLSSETERILASLWADILGQDVNSIGPRDSFIALGGDSLAAIKLVSAARLEGLQLTTQKILLCRDLGELADGVTPVGTKSNGHEDSADLPPSTAIVTMKATDFQDWAARVGASNGGWIDHLVYDFFGQLDLNKIKKSCHELVQAHAILRTTFRINDEDDVVMDIAPKQDLTFTVHNVQIDELENKSIEVYHYARVSSLGKPIVRFDLIKVTQTRYRLILRLSHAQYDGFCTKTFSDHLRLLYLSQQIPLTCPFEAFVRHILDTRYIQEAEKYWKAQLENSTMPQLVQRTSQSKACFRENPLDAEVTMSLAEPNLRGNAITVAVMAKAAWGLTLCALTRSDDVVFGDFISGRQLTFDGNIGSVVGPCVNFIPLRMRLDTNTTNREFLLNMQEHCVRASAFESLGFKYIFRHCTHWNTKPRFSSIFNYANVGHGVEETEMWTASDKDASQALQVRSSYEEKQFDKTDLWLLCSPGVEAKDGVRRLKFHLRYSTGVYTASAVESIAAIYHNAFASLVVMDERVRNPTIGDVELDQLIPKL
jgi:acyl carrier protein